MYNIKEYLAKDFKFISLEESRYCETLKQYGGECINCPIAICGDIEVVFMHYHSPEEAEKNGADVQHASTGTTLFTNFQR